MSYQICVSPFTASRYVIRSGNLLYGVPTWNSTLLQLVLGIRIILELVQEAAFVEDCVRGNVLRSVTGKTESSGGVRSDQFIGGTWTGN